MTKEEVLQTVKAALDKSTSFEFEWYREVVEDKDKSKMEENKNQKQYWKRKKYGPLGHIIIKLVYE